jgi:uncharacterized protein YciI
MTIRFLFVYFMRNEPELIRRVVPEHVRYWHDLELPGYMGGAFADRSGGSITFTAANSTEAERLVSGDPFVIEGLLEETWLKEWQTD